MAHNFVKTFVAILLLSQITSVKGETNERDILIIVGGVIGGVVVLGCLCWCCCKCCENDKPTYDHSNAYSTEYDYARKISPVTKSSHVTIDIPEVLDGRSHFVQHAAFVPGTTTQELKKYLQNGSFYKGVDWQHIKAEHCYGDENSKGQFFVKNEHKLKRQFATAGQKNVGIRNSYQTTVVEVDFNIPIGYEVKNGTRINLYRIRMVFESSLYLKTAFPVQK